MSDPSGVSAAILRFLQDILAERVPERDIPAAKRLGELAKARAGDTSEGTPSSWLAPSVAWLSGSPERWSKAIAMTKLYLDNEVPTAAGEGKLATALLRSLLSANSSGAVAFFSTIDEWGTFSALELLVPSLLLDASAASALLKRWAEFGQGDTARPISPRALTRWASSQLDVARALVEGWIDATADPRPLPIEALSPLIEGVVVGMAAGPEDPKAWRERVLDALWNDPDERVRREAVYLASSAWPPGTPVEVRHRALLAFVRHSPEQLAPAALTALLRDMPEEPDRALTTLLELVGLLRQSHPDQERFEKLLVDVAEVAWRGVLSRKDQASLPAGILPILEELLVFPPTAVQSTSLDYLLTDIWQRRVDVAEDFLARWLRAHAGELYVDGTLFEDAFQLLTHEAKMESTGRWLVGWLVDRDESLRVYAAMNAGLGWRVRISPEAVAALTTRQASALVHMLCAGMVPGERRLEILNDVLTTRGDVTALISKVVLEELCVDYPGVSRRWAEHISAAGPSVHGELIQQLARQVTETLRRRDAALEARQGVPELRATSPSYRASMEIQQEVLTQSTESAESGSLFRQLATRMPIARGEGMLRQGQASPLPFSHHEMSVELPARGFIDPVTLRVEQQQHMAEAAELLALVELS